MILLSAIILSRPYFSLRKPEELFLFAKMGF